MQNRTSLIRFAVIALVACAVLLAGVEPSCHDDGCDNASACDHCVAQCLCNSTSDLERNATVTAPSLAVVGNALSEAAQLASGTADPIFIPPRC